MNGYALRRQLQTKKDQEVDNEITQINKNTTTLEAHLIRGIRGGCDYIDKRITFQIDDLKGLKQHFSYKEGSCTIRGRYERRMGIGNSGNKAIIFAQEGDCDTQLRPPANYGNACKFSPNDSSYRSVGGAELTYANVQDVPVKKLDLIYRPWWPSRRSRGSTYARNGRWTLEFRFNQPQDSQMVLPVTGKKW